MTQGMYRFLAAGRPWQFLAGAGPASCLKGTAVHECEVQNAAAVVRLELRPLECFPSVAAHINFTRRPLLPLAFVSVNLHTVVLSIKLQNSAVTFLCFIVVVVREMFYCTAAFLRWIQRQQKQRFGPERKRSKQEEEGVQDSANSPVSFLNSDILTAAILDCFLDIWIWKLNPQVTV